MEEEAENWKLKDQKLQWDVVVVVTVKWTKVDVKIFLLRWISMGPGEWRGKKPEGGKNPY